MYAYCINKELNSAGLTRKFNSSQSSYATVMHMHAHIHAHTHTHIHTHTHTHSHTHTITYTHTHILTYTHTHTHTHKSKAKPVATVYTVMPTYVDKLEYLCTKQVLLSRCRANPPGDRTSAPQEGYTWDDSVGTQSPTSTSTIT